MNKIRQLLIWLRLHKPEAWVATKAVQILQEMSLPILPTYHHKMKLILLEKFLAAITPS